MSKRPVIGAYRTGGVQHVRAGRYSLEVPSLLQGDRGNQDFIDVWMSRYWGTEMANTMITAASNWDKHMARKTYRIELKIDFNDDTRHDALMSVAKQYARDLLGSAMLLQDGRKPACVLMTDDSFTGMEEIDILDPSDNLHVPDSANG